MRKPAAVAVTGAGGFLGREVCRALVARDHGVIAAPRTGSARGLPAALVERVEVRQADVLERASLDAALRGADAVVHCAALVSIDATCEARIRAVGVTGTQNLIQACVDQGIRRLIHVSSVHAYAGLRGTELNAASRLALDSPFPYCAAKAAGQLAVLRATQQGLIDGCVLCPASIIGPGDDRPSIVGNFMLDMASLRLPVLLDEGYWWCDVRDIADAIAAAVSAAETGATYFTPGRFAKFNDLGGIWSEALGCDVTRPVVPSWLAVVGLPFIHAYATARRMSPLYTRAHLQLTRNCPDRIADQAARTTLGYAPRPLLDSVRDALVWFRERGALR